MLVTRYQWERIKLLIDMFPEIENFELEEWNTSGIGPSTSLSFRTPDGKLHAIDITDYDKW